ncbi:hypothetical protein HNQ79_005990 [Streptomyces candidus]|uniref:Uncharacterized protein n=1 Tax=Streptomyces candidus TaxID=67283 RepID=A0A7X0HNL6_9ACTN|nr:hypothetical protein [Streptomyces candidus]
MAVSQSQLNDLGLIDSASWRLWRRASLIPQRGSAR